MKYGATGKLGFGVNPQNYVKAQHIIAENLNKLTSIGELGNLDFELSYCPIVDTKDEFKYYLDDDEVDTKKRIIYIVRWVPLDEFIGADITEMAVLLASKLLDASETLAKAGATPTQVDQFTASVKTLIDQFNQTSNTR